MEIKKLKEKSCNQNGFMVTILSIILLQENSLRQADEGLPLGSPPWPYKEGKGFFRLAAVTPKITSKARADQSDLKTQRNRP